MTSKPVFLDKSDFKSDLDDGPNVSKALHSEGGWFLMPNDITHGTAFSNDYDSVIYHECSKSWQTKSIPDERGIEKLQARPYMCWRIRARELKIGCPYCHEPVPEAIQGLWTLHNWDSLTENN